MPLKSMQTWMIHCFQATVRHQFQIAVRLLSYNTTADDGSIKVNIYIICITDKLKTCYKYMFICGPLGVTPCSWYTYSKDSEEFISSMLTSPNLKKETADFSKTMASLYQTAW
jgi:hypothetical protein